MYLYRSSHLFSTFTSCVAIFILIGHCHGFEVHTADEVVAEYGESTTISCSYTPKSSTSTFQRILWTKGENFSMHIAEIGDSHITRGRYGIFIDYESSGNLTINDVNLDDEGRYSCEVKMRGAMSKTSHVNLRVVAAPNELIIRSLTGSTPVFTHQSAVTLKPGLGAEFVCKAIGSKPPVTIKWYLDNDLVKTDQGTSTPNANDTRLHDTTSSYTITIHRLHHKKSLTCRAVIEGRTVRNTSIVINVKEPPEQPITIHSLADPITSSTQQAPFCIAGGSFPASVITWSLGGKNMTGKAVATTTVMTSGVMRVVSTLSFVPVGDDYGKILQCQVSHVAMADDIIAEKAICLSDSEMTVRVEQELSTSTRLKLSGIPHSASCTLRACDTARGSSMNDRQGAECIQRDLGSIYSDVMEHEYEVRDLMSSTTYEIVLICHHTSCGESTASAEAAIPRASAEAAIPRSTHSSYKDAELQISDSNVWIRDLIFVIIAVIVVSAFVIVVTVSVVLRAVVKGSMQVAGAQVENHVTTSPDIEGSARRSSILSSLSNNLYTIEEGREGEPKLYHEIKESRSNSLVYPSDILVSTKPNAQQRYSLGQSTRVSMRHPRPPPLPPPNHRMSVDTAVMTSSDSESEREDYVPMSPDTYSIASDISEYMIMNSLQNNNNNTD